VIGEQFRDVLVLACLWLSLATSGLAQTNPAEVGHPSATSGASSDDATAYYPARALASSISGSADLRCDLTVKIRPINCRVVSESPKDQGFGEAALKVVESFPDNLAITLDHPRPSDLLSVRFLAGPVAIYPTPGQPLHWITNPDYAERPDSSYLIRKYPKLANGLFGNVTIKCTVTVGGRMDPCQVLEEHPQGKGFGSAALDFASQFRMKPKLVDGAPVGDGTFTMTMRFGRP
jgi:TonB family protein